MLLLIRHRITFIAILVIVVAGLASYYPSFRVTLFADDWSLLESAGRLDLGDYLRQYFDPQAQTIFYRPLKGLLILAEYRWFGASFAGYHLTQTVLHLVSSLLLFTLVARWARNWRLGFLATLVFVTLPLSTNATSHSRLLLLPIS